MSYPAFSEFLTSRSQFGLVAENSFQNFWRSLKFSSHSLKFHFSLRTEDTSWISKYFPRLNTVKFLSAEGNRDILFSLNGELWEYYSLPVNDQ